MPEINQADELLAKAEEARDKIATELARLKAQAKGLQQKIQATEARLQGADEMIEVMKPKKGGS